MDYIRVVIADDHELVRAGIRTVLGNTTDIEIVGEAGDGEEAIRLVEEQNPNVLLTDLAMPGLSGLELTRQMAGTFRKVRVIILSMYSDDEHVYLALRAGAAGYLIKSASRQELPLAIRAVATGDTYVSATLSGALVKNYAKYPSVHLNPLSTLSHRQTQVLQLITESKTTKQIALELNISVKTVECHRAQLMDRLEIHDVPGLVRFAIKSGLVHL
ncbi:MAG TPA: response regulator transcription factor [Pyrinomonadaceae bacterium]|nr:response regulator transcription factor [Pyrinomonadaceae bacterium]